MSVYFDCVKWRRRRDWFCCATSVRDHLRRPIFAALGRTRWFSSHPSCRNFTASPQMAEKEGLVSLRNLSLRPPVASHLLCAPSNFVLIPFRCRGCIDLALPNGGEGGIGVAAQPLIETACGVPSPLRSVEPDGSHLILLTAILRLCLKWRRRRDSNPRCHF